MPASCSRSILETGELQWKWYATPQKAGSPGLETGRIWTRPSTAAAIRGCLAPSIPETRLYIIATVIPLPAYTSATRGFGDNLLHVRGRWRSTGHGKMAWYYQTSPHDTHDWDSAQTPILVDGTFGGRARKLVLTAAPMGILRGGPRNASTCSQQVLRIGHWATGLNERDSRCATGEGHHIGGALVAAANQARPTGRTVLQPDTGLFYVPTADPTRVYYTDPRPERRAGPRRQDERPVGTAELSDRHRLQDGEGGVAPQVQHALRGARHRVLTTAGGCSLSATSRATSWYPIRPNGTRVLAHAARAR